MCAHLILAILNLSELPRETGFKRGHTSGAGRVRPDRREELTQADVAEHTWKSTKRLKRVHQTFLNFGFVTLPITNPESSVA